MTDRHITPEGRQFLAAREAEAREIVAHGGEYTTSQRALAWAVLAQARARKLAAVPVARAEDGAA